MVVFVRVAAAQCLELPAFLGVAAACVRIAYASANARGWSIGGQNPNLRADVIHGGRSILAVSIFQLRRVRHEAFATEPH